MPRRKTIGLQPSEYNILAATKDAHEASTGEKIDWGQFLLFLLSLYVVSQVVNNKNKTVKRGRHQ